MIVRKRGDLWVIPFDSEENYHIDILIGQEHTEGLIDFVRRNSLPLDIKVDDYHESPCLLASLGYMVVKSENDSSILVYYIPEMISENQRDWFIEHRYLEMEYIKIGGYSLNENWKIIESFEGIKREIKEKYVMESRNFRK